MQFLKGYVRITLGFYEKGIYTVLKVATKALSIGLVRENPSILI